MEIDQSLTIYMNQAIHAIVKQAAATAIGNPRQLAFLIKFNMAMHSAQERRANQKAEDGTHVPPFLIASITSNCNLFCTGCYARANGICHEHTTEASMSVAEWETLFSQAQDLGVAFILLAGGEPLLRKDVIQAASRFKRMIFPIFTNGTLVDAEYLELFHAHRNLLPIISLEGTESATDARRGAGVYATLRQTMRALDKRGIFQGVSLTVTKGNLDEITSDRFISHLNEAGSRVVFFIEYVPVAEGACDLAPDDACRARLEIRQAQLRQQYGSMLFLSFPGDEKKMGGCLAAGRGFFHINTEGSAENCPFSPFSDRNIRTSTLLEVLKSPLFRALRDEQLVGGEHHGGCALFERQEDVRRILAQVQTR